MFNYNVAAGGPFARRRGFRPWHGMRFGRYGHGWGPHHHWGRGHGPGFGGFGPGNWKEPRMDRGHLKYLILDTVKDQPRHGYDIIRALGEQFHGWYTPSPGSVYPTLQLLEDQGYLAGEQREGKKVYAITDAGRQLLAERAEELEGIRSRMGGNWGFKNNPELHQLMAEAAQLGQLIFRQGRSGALGDEEKVKRLRELLARVRQEVEAIFTGGSETPPTVL